MGGDEGPRLPRIGARICASSKSVFAFLSMAELLAHTGISTTNLAHSVLSVDDLGDCLTGVSRTGALR